MANETEKLTLNLGIVELAQIDVLAARGLYANRSDFIRTAIRKHLENYEDMLHKQLVSISSDKYQIGGIGIITLSRNLLESLEKECSRVKINIIGMLVVDKKISVELFKNTVEYISIRGKLIASDELQKIISVMNDARTD